MTAPFVGGGALAGTIARTMAPLAERLLRQFGSDVSVYRATEARRPDNSTVRQWAPIPVTPPRVALTHVTAQYAARVWGAERQVTAEGYAPVSLGIQEGDGLEVTGGPYTGERFLIVAIVADPVSGIARCGLRSTREVFHAAP